MTKIKVAEASGHVLDWLVAKCEGFDAIEYERRRGVTSHRRDDAQPSKYAPTTNWGHGGPIIERGKIDLEWTASERCRASYDWLDEEFFEAFGPTPLIAAMRCYVASKLGEKVEVPDELLEE